MVYILISRIAKLNFIQSHLEDQVLSADLSQGLIGFSNEVPIKTKFSWGESLLPRIRFFLTQNQRLRPKTFKKSIFLKPIAVLR
jgi:hypothetical protein